MELSARLHSKSFSLQAPLKSQELELLDRDVLYLANKDVMIRE